MTGQGGVGSPIKGMICKVYPVREGDTMPYEQIAATGNFPWYRKVESPRQGEIERFRRAREAGMDYDVMANQLVDPATGERTDLKTGEPVEA